MNEGSGNVGSDDIERQFRIIREDFTTLSGLLREIGEAKTGEKRDAAMAQANELLERARATLEDGRLKAQAATASIEDHIRTKPVQSAMIALGVGFLVGILTRR